MKAIAISAAVLAFVGSASSAWAIMKYNPGRAGYNTASGYQRQYATPQSEAPGMAGAADASMHRKRKAHH